MVHRPCREPLRLGPSGPNAEQRDECRLGMRRVLSGRFAELVGRGSRIQHVIGDLKGQADRFAVRSQRFDGSTGDAVSRRQTADHAGRGNKRASLAAMYLLERFDWERLGFGLEIGRASWGKSVDLGGRRIIKKKKI